MDYWTKYQELELVKPFKANDLTWHTSANNFFKRGHFYLQIKVSETHLQSVQRYIWVLFDFLREYIFWLILFSLPENPPL